MISYKHNNCHEKCSFSWLGCSTWKKMKIHRENLVLPEAMAKLSSFVNPIPINNPPFLGKQGTVCVLSDSQFYFIRRNVKKFTITYSKVYLKYQILRFVSMTSEIWLTCTSIIKGRRGDFWKLPLLLNFSGSLSLSTWGVINAYVIYTHTKM